MGFWQIGANTLAQGNLICNKRLGKYGPIKAFMVHYLHYRSGYKDAHLTMDRRGGLESARGFKLSYIPISKSGWFP